MASSSSTSDGHLRNLRIEDCSELVTFELSPSSSIWSWRHMNRLKGINITGCCNLQEVLIAGGEYIDDEPCSDDPAVSMKRYTVPNEPVDIDITKLKSFGKPVALLSSLQNIILRKLPKAKIVWQGGSLKNLSSLNISSCSGLEFLISRSEDTPHEQAPSHESPMETVLFPSLKELELNDLPNMKSISPECVTIDLPNLSNLKVVRCNKLKTLKLAAGSLRELQCTHLWWNRLEWDSDNLKSSFSHVVKHIR